MPTTGCVPLCRTAEGAAALLLQNGPAGYDCVCSEQLAGAPGESELVAAAASAAAEAGALAMCRAPSAASGSSCDEAELRSRLRARSHRFASDACVLFLLPAAYVNPPDSSALAWVPAGDLAAQTVRISPRLSRVLETPAALKMLQKLSQPAGGRPAEASGATEDEPPPPDPSVPRRLAPDLFLGELEAAANEELLKVLGVRRILLGLPDAPAVASAPAEATSADASVAAAVAVASKLGAEVCVVRQPHEALESGMAAALLQEACGWIEEGLDSGCVLVCGPLTVPASPATWLSATYLAATLTAPARQPVAKAFAACRALFPGCRMSATQAAEAEGAAARWKVERVAFLAQQKQLARKGKAAPDAAAVAAPAWLRTPESLRPSAGASAGCDAQPPPALADGLACGGAEAAAGLAAGDEDALAVSAAAPQPSHWQAAPQHNTVALTLASPGAPASAGGGAGGQAAAGGQGAPVAALERSVWYRCRKCRTPIFSEAMLEPHEEGKGQTAFEYRRRDARVGGGLGCTSHFLSEKAMATLSELEGKICCPRCSTRIGGYHWAGMQCSCGAWVAPAVQVVKSKIDESIVLSAPAVAAANRTAR